ncbi:MAG: ATP synthase F1 subunit epsilon [Bacillota bacterium]|nr:ATP synthase F1 subunit epsilon [Bacillota bacterium]
MARKFRLQVISPDRTFFEGETDMVILRAVDGYLSIMYDHQPTVALLAVGSMRIRNEDGSFSWAACTDGILTVKDTAVTVLVNAAEWVDEIDLPRAIEARKRAEARLNAPTSDSIDSVRARAALERAINRIKLGEVRK